MLKKSSIILLDEATSSLDADTEQKIQQALTLLTKNKTTIVIAHRLSTILNSDQIYVIDSGKVIANGSHAELLENSPVYKNFYDKQITKINDLNLQNLINLILIISPLIILFRLFKKRGFYKI